MLRFEMLSDINGIDIWFLHLLFVGTLFCILRNSRANNLNHVASAVEYIIFIYPIIYWDNHGLG